MKIGHYMHYRTSQAIFVGTMPKIFVANRMVMDESRKSKD